MQRQNILYDMTEKYKSDNKVVCVNEYVKLYIIAVSNTSYFIDTLYFNTFTIYKSKMKYCETSKLMKFSANNIYKQ